MEPLKKDTLNKFPITQNKACTLTYAQTVKTPIPPKGAINIPPNIVFPKYIPYDIAHILSQIKFIMPIFEFLMIPEHRKMAFEYLGFKEKMITQGKNVNGVDVPPIIIEMEVPQALKEFK